MRHGRRRLRPRSSRIARSARPPTRLPYLRAGRDHCLCPRVRSSAIPSRRGCSQGLAVRRPGASGWHTAAIYIRGIVTRRMQRRRRGQGRAAAGLRAIARLPQSVLAKARIGRRHRNVPRPPGREDRPQIAPRPRPARHRCAGAQSARRNRVRHHLADTCGAPRAGQACSVLLAGRFQRSAAAMLPPSTVTIWPVVPAPLRAPRKPAPRRSRSPRASGDCRPCSRPRSRRAPWRAWPPSRR